MEQGHGRRGGPQWSQAGQDLRGRRRTRGGARQYRTSGRGGKSRVGPKEQEAADAAVGGCTPEGARGAGQGSSTVAFAEAAVPEQTSQR